VPDPLELPESTIRNDDTFQQPTYPLFVRPPFVPDMKTENTVNSRLTSTRTIAILLATAFAVMFSHPSEIFAQPEQSVEDAFKEANAELVKLLDATDNLFYKTKKNDQGGTFYTIVWESEGESSKIILGLKKLGHYNNKYVFAISAWTYVARSDDPMPPAVIKAIALESDSLLVGSYSCSKDFKQVYANMSGVLENASTGSIWMYCAYLHTNRLGLKEKVDQALAGTSG